MSSWINLICLIVFSALSISKVLASSLELELNRKMINHFTNYLSSTQDNIEGVLFDLSADRFLVTAIFEGQNFSMLNWIKPTLRPGEIFLSASQRTGKVSSLDEKDFVVVVKVECDLFSKSSDLDSVYLKFKQPKVGAYYRQDLHEYRKKQLELGKILGRYDSLQSSLGRINGELKSLKSDHLDSQLSLTAKKLEVRQQLNHLGGELDALNRQLVRFSGSYLSVLPSDNIIQDAIKSLDGNVNGDSILREVFRRFKEMDVAHPKLDIKLMGNISGRSGTIRVGNIGKSLIGIVPGLKVKKLRIMSKATEAHTSSGLRTQNHILSLEADVINIRGSK